MTDIPIIIITPTNAKQASSLIKKFSEMELNAQTVRLQIPDAKPSVKEKPKASKLPKVTINALKEILTEVKEELGSDVLKNLFVVHDAKSLKTLDEADWPTMYAEAEALLNPKKSETEEEDPFDFLDDDKDDDDLGLDGDDDDLGLDGDEDDLGLDDNDLPEVSLADVKKLASKYSDKFDLDDQRAVLSKFGIATTRSLGKASTEQLSKIHAAFTKGLK